MNPKIRTVLLFPILLFALSLAAGAQTKSENQPGQLGPKEGAGLTATDLNQIKTGATAPDFTLEDQDGRAVSLSDYQGKKNVVLVFYRGYW